jgi:prefoldin subunit 5
MLHDNVNANLQILQRQIDLSNQKIEDLYAKLEDLDDLRQVMRLPDPRNKDRYLLEVEDNSKKPPSPTINLTPAEVPD